MSNPFMAEIKELPVNKEGVRNYTKAFENKIKDITTPKEISTINEKYEGTGYPGTDVEYKRSKILMDGKLCEGVFPRFESKFNVMLPKELHKASDDQQFKYCVEQLKKKIETNPELKSQFTDAQLQRIKDGAPRIPGLTWHHNEKQGLIQLVDAETHGICKHTGGRKIWGGGTYNR